MPISSRLVVNPGLPQAETQLIQPVLGSLCRHRSRRERQADRACRPPTRLCRPRRPAGLRGRSTDAAIERGRCRHPRRRACDGDAALVEFTVASITSTRGRHGARTAGAPSSTRRWLPARRAATRSNSRRERVRLYHHERQNPAVTPKTATPSAAPVSASSRRRSDRVVGIYVPGGRAAYPSHRC